MLRKILLIDDDDVDRMSIKRALKHSEKTNMEFSFSEASDAQLGLNIILNEPLDCIFLDYLLPDSDGLEVLRRIREHGIITPIIMMTGHGDEKLAVKLMKAGATDYITKNSIDADELLLRVSRSIHAYEAEKQKLETEAALHKSNEQIVSILESISDAFISLDQEFNLIHLNSQAESLLLIDPQQALRKNVFEVLPFLEPWLNISLTLAQKNNSHLECEGEYSPSQRWLEAQIYPTEDNISIYFSDITQRRKNEERLNYLANYDSLTGLPNRILLMDRLVQALTRAPWRKRQVGVLFCDLDRFKIVNDSLGHDAGDRLLSIVADRLKDCIRCGDTVSRIGGDEFVIILADLARSEDISTILQKLIDAVSVPIRINSQELFVTVSIGVSLFPDDGVDASILLKNADIAMYSAKDKGKNCYHLYSNALEERHSNRLTLETDLRRSVENQDFIIYYQPIVDTQTDKIVSAEALLRWQHPERGLIFPDEFIVACEETGIIMPLGNWIIETLCQQLVEWHQIGFDDLRIALNISNRQFNHESFNQDLMSYIHQAGLSPQSIQIELTEHIVMSNIERALQHLHNYRDMGFSLAVDDFGTGYSSLAHLKLLPLNTLKIDKSFILNVINDKNDMAITKAIIAMTHELGLTVTAEGVETDAHYKFLKTLGCDYCQGYWMSRAVPAEEFVKLLKQHY
ncbi:MAG: EAL domain-containing protein [Gammaproteobacteria bacterium]|nr:EAL domain-containing protein [Gammaproteobacteria bacterium]